MNENMRKMLGFIIFWVAIGMLLMVLIGSRIVGVTICAVFLLVGYNLFYC